MKRRNRSIPVVLGLVIACFASVLAIQPASAAPPPNVLVIAKSG